MNRAVRGLFLFCFFSLFPAGITESAEVAFIGLRGEGAPSIEKSFDQMLRNSLSITPDFKTADYLTVQRYKEKIDFHGHPVVSANLLDALSQIAPESTVFVWGTVTNYRFKPVRRRLIRSAVSAELSIDLSVYSLSNSRYAFSGTIEVTGEKEKGFVLFSPVEKVVHISAADITGLMDQPSHSAVKECKRIISIVLNSQTDQRDQGDDDHQDQAIPSLYDVFTVPSMEAQPLYDTKRAEFEENMEILPEDNFEQTDILPDSEEENVEQIDNAAEMIPHIEADITTDE